MSPPPLKSLPADMELVLKVIPMPADCNANGDIFGGWVMAQCDLAGSVIPARYAKGRMATVAVNEFVFKQPVRLGDILSFYSKLVRDRPHLGDGHGRGVRRALPGAGRVRQGDGGDASPMWRSTTTEAAADREGLNG